MLLRCCCSVAVLLRWCCGSVAVVPVEGPVSGLVGGMVRWSSWRSGRLSGHLIRSASQSVIWSVAWSVVRSVVWSMAQSIVRSVRSVWWVAAACPVDGPVVRLVVRSSVIRSAIRSVAWSVVWGGPVCGLVDVAVRAVCGPVETRPALYLLQWPAGFRCLDSASRGLRVSWCCSVAEGFRMCCGGPVVRLAVGSGQWSGRWSGWWSGLWSGRWSSLWSGPCGLWSVETRPAPYSGMPASKLGYWSQGACVLL